MSKLITPVRFSGRQMLPQAPPDICEEVELYARQSDRTAKMHFIPYGGWFVRFELRCNAPALLAFREGRAAEPDTEDVFFHISNPYEGQTLDLRGKPEAKKYPLIALMDFGMRKQGAWMHLDIMQMGVSGVRTFLERGNVESGRGEFTSHMDAVTKARAANAAFTQKNRENARDNSQARVTEILRYKLRTFVGRYSRKKVEKGD